MGAIRIMTSLKTEATLGMNPSKEVTIMAMMAGAGTTEAMIMIRETTVAEMTMTLEGLGTTRPRHLVHPPPTHLRHPARPKILHLIHHLLRRLHQRPHRKHLKHHLLLLRKIPDSAVFWVH